MQTSEMKNWKTLKMEDPQKYYLKWYCRFLYYLGFGDSWYEETKRSKLHSIIYAIISVLARVYLAVILVDQVLAYLRTDLTEKERATLLVFTVAHPTVVPKFIVWCLKKNRIKLTMQRLLNNHGNLLKSLELERSDAKTAVRLCTFYVSSVSITVFSALIESVTKYFIEGHPIGNPITYYPTISHTGSFANNLRLCIEVHWWYEVTIMCTIDCVVFSSLKFLGCRFKLMQIYFRNIKNKTLYNQGKKSKAELKAEFKRDFITGITLHEDLLRIADDLQNSFGLIYSLQTLQSLTLTAMCLLKLVSNQHDLIFLATNLVFIFQMIVLTGFYMTLAGDITYEASEVSAAIYDSGWELVNADKEIRTLVVLAMIRSQRPVIMTAFGIIPMSYENFISVLRLAYSFFAVMY